MKNSIKYNLALLGATLLVVFEYIASANYVR